MKLETIIHTSDFTVEKELIDREISKNITGKLDAYLKKYDTPNNELRLDVTITRDRKKEERSKSTVSGKIILLANGKTFISVRESFEKLEDLIQHLFMHIKDQLSK